MFVVNLAFSDLCMMTTMGLPVIINAFTQRYWMWGPFGDLKIKLKASAFTYFYFIAPQHVGSTDVLEASSEPAPL